MPGRVKLRWTPRTSPDSTSTPHAHPSNNALPVHSAKTISPSQEQHRNPFQRQPSNRETARRPCPSRHIFPSPGPARTCIAPQSHSVLDRHRQRDELDPAPRPPAQAADADSDGADPEGRVDSRDPLSRAPAPGRPKPTAQVSPNRPGPHGQHAPSLGRLYHDTPPRSYSPLDPTTTATSTTHALSPRHLSQPALLPSHPAPSADAHA
jgi:hypothetical protein